MDIEITGRYFIQNTRLLTVNKINQISITQPSIYEVIRVIDGTPLFLEDHIKRLQQSSIALKADIQKLIDHISSDIETLIRLNDNPDKNLKLIVYNLEKDYPDYFMCFIKSTYPTELQYRQGVHTILVQAERNNPNAKVTNNELRQMTNKKMAEANAYEALLVNNTNEITEGSRSNLFFLKHGKIYTAPAQDVLLGITRQYIIKACNNLGLEVIEQPIPISIVDHAAGAFITGTSPKLLPIKSIDNLKINSADNKTILSIMKEYDNILKQYIENHK